MPASGAPSILNKSYTITAEVEIPEGGAEGMIVTEGGRFGGYGLFLSKGEFGIRPGQGRCSSTTCSTSSARRGKGPSWSAGKHTIVFDFKSDGPGLGKGGTGVLSVDGKEVARNSMEHTTPVTFPEDETFDVGQDTRTGVALMEYRYDVPFKFTGKIDKLTFKLEPEQRGAAQQLTAVADEIASAKVASRDEEGADFRRCRRSRDRIGVADRPVARRAVVVRRGTDRRRHTGSARGWHRPDRVRGRLLAGRHSPVGMLIYSAAVTLYLAYVGFAGGLTGIFCGRRSSFTRS